MRAVYRRLARLGLALLVATGCREAPPPERSDPPPPTRRSSLPSLLESFEVTPAAACGADAIRFGTLSSAGASRAVRIDGPVALPGLPAPSSTLVQLAADRALVQAGGRLWLAGPGDTARALALPAPGTVRLLAAGEAEAWLAIDAPDGSVLVRVEPGGGVRATARLPAGLEPRVASRDGARVALVRRDDDGDLLFLHEPAAAATRILLPDDGPGRFDPLLFSLDGARLLLVADDGGMRPRFEWLDLADGGRTPVDAGECAPHGARLRLDGALALETSCRDKATLELREEGAERRVPVTGDGWPAAAWPDGPAGWLYAVASPRHPRDLWRTGAFDDASPIVYGLAPRVDSADLVDAEALSLAAASGDLPATLWRPRLSPDERALGGVVWLGREDGPPRALEFDPVVQFLAQRGIAVLQLDAPAARSAEDPGRAASAERTLLEHAAALLRDRAALAGAPVALVASGPRASTVALEAAGRPGPFVAVAALDAPAAAPLPDARTGAPLLVFASALPASNEPLPPAPEAPVAVADDRLRIAEISPADLGLPAEVAAALWRHLERHFRLPAGRGS